MNEMNEVRQNSDSPSQAQYHFHYHYYSPQLYPNLPAELEPKRSKRRVSVKSALRNNANAVCGGLLLLTVVSIITLRLSDFLARLIISANTYVEARYVIELGASIFSYAASYIIAILLIRMWLRIPARTAFPMRMKGFSVTLPAILICLGVSVIGRYCYDAVSVVLESAFGIVPIVSDYRSPDGNLPIALYIISLVILPAVLEELLFRGVAMQSLRRFGDGFALVVSSILFGLFHGNLPLLIPAFLTGLAIGYFVLRTGSVLTGILIHLVNKGIIVAVDLLTKGGGEGLVTVAGSILEILCLASGVIAVVFLLWRHPGIFRLASSNVSLKKKYALFFTAAASVIFVVVALGLSAMMFMTFW